MKLKSSLFLLPTIFAGTIVSWLSYFPVKGSFSHSDVLFEGVYLIAAGVSYFVIGRLRDWRLSVGWGVFTYGLLFDFLDEFTREAGSPVDVDAIQDLLTTIGLILITIGFVAAVREREADRENEVQLSNHVRSEKTRLATIIDSVHDAILVTNPKGEVLLANASALHFSGLTEDEIVGNSIEDSFALFDGVLPLFPMALELPSYKLSKKFFQKDYTMLSRHGESYLFEVVASELTDDEGAKFGIVWCLHEVAERREHERQLSQAGRLESVGLLAGGVAHDFNNLLSSIMNWTSYSAVLKENGGDDEEVFTEIKKACNRGKKLASQLLAFSKGGKPIVESVGLAALIRESTEFALRGSAVKLDMPNIENHLYAMVDASQMGQVVQNLVINAKQAMSDSGTITISAKLIELEEDEHLHLEDGEYVRVDISDHGQGVDAASLPSIFEPYFSTKTTGYGLGLATCYAVLKRHGGHIEVESEVGVGTMFTFFVPAGGSGEAAEVMQEIRSTYDDLSLLIVDDDYSVQKPLAATLRACGVDVEACLGGDEALLLYKRRLARGEPFDLVLMDLTLQGESSGAEVMSRICEFHPIARGIVMSGYHDDPVMSNYRESGFVAMLAKPFEHDQLLSVINLALKGGKNQ